MLIKNLSMVGLKMFNGKSVVNVETMGSDVSTTRYLPDSFTEPSQPFLKFSKLLFQ